MSDFQAAKQPNQGAPLKAAERRTHQTHKRQRRKRYMAQLTDLQLKILLAASKRDANGELQQVVATSFRGNRYLTGACADVCIKEGAETEANVESATVAPLIPRYLKPVTNRGEVFKLTNDGLSIVEQLKAKETDTTTNKAIKAILATALLCAYQSAMAATTTINGITWRYTVSNNTVTLGETVQTGAGEGKTSWETYPAIPTSTTGAITVPTKISGMNVVNINDCAFQDCEGLTKVTISSSGYVTNIGSYAFCNCTGLTSISIPSKVKRIGDGAFEGCTGLTSATIYSSVISQFAFNRCSNLSSVSLGSQVKSIGHRAFSGCANLIDMTIPSTVSYIEDCAFLYGSYEGDDGPQTPFGLKLEAAKTIVANKVMSGDISLETPNPRYNLTQAQEDRAIASVTVSADTTLSNFVLSNGKVYDTVLRIANTASQSVKVTLPNGYTYETLKGATPLTIPANSTNLLTITRITADTFFVSRRELEKVQ